MELNIIKSKIDELARGDQEFAQKFAEMSIHDLGAFPKTAAEALSKRDLKKLSFANHQMKTLIGLFQLNALGALLENSLELFEKGDLEKKEFLANVEKEIEAAVKLIKQAVSHPL